MFLLILSIVFLILGYSNQKEVYVDQLDFITTSDGTFGNPFPNLITTFKNLEAFTEL